MKARLFEFARTGIFGDIHLGMKSLGVRRLLGPPEGWQNRWPVCYRLDGGMVANPDQKTAADNGRQGFWCYGDIEFYFEDSRLFMIFWDQHRPIDAGPIDVDPWIVRPRLAMPEMEGALAGARIGYKRGVRAIDGAWTLMTDGGVQYVFHLGDECLPPPGLTIMAASIHRPIGVVWLD